MLNRSDFSTARRQQLSSLMDGDLADGEAARTSILWRQDASTRQDWHAYHLIGDVLRSEDLAAQPAHDEAFLQALRQRLAKEPVPLAPMATMAAAAPSSAPSVTPQRVANGSVAVAPARRRGWLMAPMAVAAGFVAVAGVLVVTRALEPQAPSAALASSGSPTTTASAVLVRDTQLDRYLSAHRSLANGAMPGVEHRMHVVFEGQ